MRNMSFAMTTEQVKARTKTVTRRFGWWFLKPGDKVQAVEKAMGLKKGQKIQRIAVIKIVSTRPEPLDEITKNDCIKEGFPEFEPSDFVRMICEHYKQDSKRVINRIEFKYV
ncbi:hypothetical protein LCGC14_0403650 [marine sediment metagenome]|uniref:ASCH domain-containing protein n=1 Tax=marine sediment metagenome TaxID=412755 RepID=A0A0F9TE83_9ZZZZ